MKSIASGILLGVSLIAALACSSSDDNTTVGTTTYQIKGELQVPSASVNQYKVGAFKTDTDTSPVGSPSALTEVASASGNYAYTITGLTAGDFFVKAYKANGSAPALDSTGNVLALFSDVRTADTTGLSGRSKASPAYQMNALTTYLAKKVAQSGNTNLTSAFNTVLEAVVGVGVTDPKRVTFENGVVLVDGTAKALRSTAFEAALQQITILSALVEATPVASSATKDFASVFASLASSANITEVQSAVNAKLSSLSNGLSGIESALALFNSNLATTVGTFSTYASNPNVETSLTTGSSKISGSLDQGILNKSQLANGTYKASAATGSLVVETASLVTVASDNVVRYNFKKLKPSTTYKIDIFRQTASGNKVTIASTVATTAAAVSAKARYAAKTPTAEINMFSSHAAKVYAKQVAAGNTASALGSALTDLFPASVSANLSSLEGIKVKKGVATRVDSTGNTVSLKIRPKANAKIKFASQVAKSAVYLKESNLEAQAHHLEKIADEVAHADTMASVSAFYKTPEFTGMMKNVKKDLAEVGGNLQSMMRELDPVLANMDAIKALHLADFESELFDVDSLDHVFSADNLTKQLFSYELAMESYIKDVPGLSYDVASHEFFGEIGHEFGDAFDSKAWVTESMNELTDIFDDFVHEDESFTFKFETADLTSMFSDTFKEMSQLEGHGQHFGSDDFQSFFAELDFSDLHEDFASHSIALGDIYDEDELDDFFANETGYQLFHFDLAHPTYGYRKVLGPSEFNYYVGTLAPVFRVEFLPTDDFMALTDDQLEELFSLSFTVNGETTEATVENLTFSTLRHDADPNVLYLAFHKSPALELTETDLAPGETYSFVLTPNTLASGNVSFVDGSSSYTGKLIVKPVTFTVPFDESNLYTQVDLFAHEDDHFEEFIEGADVEDHFKMIEPSVLQESGATGSVRTAAQLDVDSALVSQSGVYEVFVDNGAALQWDVNGTQVSIDPTSDYLPVQFFDVDQEGFAEPLEVIGTPSAMAMPLMAAPSILVHSAYGITVNESASDLGLFDTDKLRLAALNHAMDHGDDEEESDVSEEAFIGTWVDQSDNNVVLVVSEDFTWFQTGDQDGDAAGEWDFFDGILTIFEIGEDAPESMIYSFEKNDQDETLMIITDSEGTTIWVEAEEEADEEDEILGGGDSALEELDLDDLVGEEVFLVWFDTDANVMTAKIDVLTFGETTFSANELNGTDLSIVDETYEISDNTLSFVEDGTVVEIVLVDASSEHLEILYIEDGDMETAESNRIFLSEEDAQDYADGLDAAQGDFEVADESFFTEDDSTDSSESDAGTDAEVKTEEGTSSEEQAA